MILELRYNTKNIVIRYNFQYHVFSPQFVKTKAAISTEQVWTKCVTFCPPGFEVKKSFVCVEAQNALKIYSQPGPEHIY